jgi:hypothetical protein
MIITRPHFGYTRLRPLEEMVRLLSPHNGHSSPFLGGCFILVMASELYALEVRTTSSQSYVHTT